MSDFNSNYTPPPDIHIPAFDSSAQSAFQANTQVPSFDPSTQASVPAFPTFDPSMQAPFPDSGTFSTFDPSTQAPFPDNGTFPNFDPSTQGPAPDAGTFSPFDPSTQGFSSSDPGMSFPQDNFSSPGPDPSFPFDPGFAPPDYDNSATFDSGLAPIPDFYGPPDMGTTLPDPPPFDAESGGQTFSFEPVASVPLDFDQKTMGPPSFDLPPTDLTLGMDTATATYTDVRVDDFLTAFHEASFGPPSFDEPQPGDPNNAVESAAVSTVEPGKSAEPVADTSARLDTAAASTTDSNATQTPETGGSSNSSASADGGVTQSAGGNESGAAAKSEAGNSGMTEFRVWPGGQYERADGSAYDYQASQSFVQNGETYYQNVEVRPDGTVVVHEYRGSEGFNIEHTSVTPGPDAGPPVPGAGTQAPDTSQAPASPEAKPDHDKSVDSGGLGPTLQAIDHFLVPRADEHPFARGVMDNLYKRGEGIASDPAALFGFRPDKTLLGFAQSFITLGKAADDVYYYMMHPDSQEGERKLGSAVVDGAFETPNVIGVAEGAFGALGGGAGVAAAEAGAGAGKPSGEGTPSGLAEPKEATPPSKGEGPAAAETAPPREAPVAAEPVAPPAQEGGGEPPATAGGSEQNPAPAAAEPQGQPPAEPPAEPRASEEPAEPHNSEPEPHDAEPEPHDAEPEPHDAEPEPHDAESEPHDAESEPHDAESEPHDAEPEPHDAESEPSSAEPEPNSAEPEPNSAEPEPNSAEPGPNSAEPEPQQAEPEPHDPQSEPQGNETEPSSPEEGNTEEGANDSSGENEESTQTPVEPSENPNSGARELNLDAGASATSNKPRFYRGRKPLSAIVPAPKPKFGNPSGDSSGTGLRTGMRFGEKNAAEISSNFNLDYNQGAGRPNSVTYEVHAGVRERTAAPEERAFARDSSTEGAQSSDSAYTGSGYERGHLAQREVFKENTFTGADHLTNRGDVPQGIPPQRVADQFTNVVPMKAELNRGTGSRWRAAEVETLNLADELGSVTVKVVPRYAENPPRLSDGTPIPDSIERTVYDSNGNQIRHDTFDNR